MENLVLAYEIFFFIYGALEFDSLFLWRDCFYFVLGLGYQKFDTVWYGLQNISKFVSGLVQSVNSYDGRLMADF